MSQLLVYMGAFLAIGWGIAHLVPTKNVVAGFGDISSDNRNIITMEWIVEGVALIFIGSLNALVVVIDSGGVVPVIVHAASFVALLALSLVSLFTGYRVHFLPFRMCPFVLGMAGVLILLGGLT